MTMRASSASSVDVDALFAPLANEASLLFAVSGGPDSVALMLLASRWSLRKDRRIAIATVDHGLRAGSSNEASLVGEWSRALGFTHHVLEWREAKPKTRIQERAREARYRLLTGCAQDIGASAIVTGHHADDQAETILFRLTRGSGVAGLAGMSSVSTLGELRLHRPLLQLRKAQLEDICNQADQAFVRDPSNENIDFARTRIRQLQATLASQGLDLTALLRLGARASQANEALAWISANIAASAEAERIASNVQFEANMLRGIPVEILQRILATEISRISSKAPLRLERLERAARRMNEALNLRKCVRMTLGGAILTLDERNLAIATEKPRRATAVRSQKDANRA